MKRQSKIIAVLVIFCIGSLLLAISHYSRLYAQNDEGGKVTKKVEKKAKKKAEKLKIKFPRTPKQGIENFSL